MKRTWTLTAFVGMALISVPALGQTLEQRMQSIRTQEDRAAVAEQQAQQQGQMSVQARLNQVIEQINLDNVTIREAFQIWQEETGIPVSANWQALELDGAELNERVNLQLSQIPARAVLQILLEQASSDLAELIDEPTQWYVGIMTKRAANERTRETRVYDITDLLMMVPDFPGPMFDLESATQQAGGGGGGGRGGGGGGRGGGRGSGLFGNDQDDQESMRMDRRARAEMIANLIRSTVEPEIWRYEPSEIEMGGRGGGGRGGGGSRGFAQIQRGEQREEFFGSISHHENSLIINAPRYVHRQIGEPMQPQQRPAAAAQQDRSRGQWLGTEDPRPQRAPRRGVRPGVSGVAP